MEQVFDVKINVDYLKKYKDKKNLTNKELADLIGVHESTISRILNGKKGVGYKFIVGVFYRLDDLDVKKLFVLNDKRNVYAEG
ncbi:helix-turn-helix domain-containing protein [Caldifermentibacillus hisashii]|uniref:Helix-turn-helix domain-containing protein n=1 Tax=Caldifermentibacillus hisashii TaxID=996558 RepID=A0ABU9K352_9BACI|nr:helix-turn-helix domain-containing protein [Caldifermentibacillus hisashii]MED4852177.1 helix-turn-helix domain-containing protein [Caldifermentibacillus hisashii]